jgi:CheY-like chemotaxis protein
MKKEEMKNLIGSCDFDERYSNLGDMLAIDTITVDRYSRLTLTKEVKNNLHIEAGDKIAVYRDKYVPDELLFRIQRGRNFVDNWKLQRYVSGIDNNEKRSSSNSIISSNSDWNRTNGSENSTAQYTLDTKDRTRNIMLVDDEPDVLYSFQISLFEEGYNVIPFSKSKEAVKHLIDLNNPTSYYDLAIIDIRMPELNGIQLYHMLKIINKNLKVLFISALDAADEILSMFPEINSRNIIRKPVSQSHFVNKVKDIITD